VDDSGSSGQAFFPTTEDTEVTEALGSLASHLASRRIRYNRFLVQHGIPDDPEATQAQRSAPW